LKPENILLMEKGESLSIKVADFGSSVVLDPDARLSGCYGSAYYLAPEVFGKSYNEKCDIWSVGIIMYILLTGKPPYTGRDSEQILKQAEKTPFVLTPTKLFGISEDAADLLKQLLKHNPAQRISAKAALQHKWLQSHRDKLGADTDLALKNLQNFNCQSKLKEAVYVFVASQITSHEDLKYFRDCFLKLDKDGDGKLTKEELIQEYSKSMTREKAEEISNSVIEKLDQDNDGMIDYTEFLVSCQERLKNISLDNLEIAFRMFDADGNGEISAEEIKEILNDGAIDDEDIWKIILKEADTNGDGLVDLKEFINMMTAMKTMKSAKSGNSAGVKSYVSTQQVLK
jgi:calcium-dependent protein kinase